MQKNRTLQLVGDSERPVGSKRCHDLHALSCAADQIIEHELGARFALSGDAPVQEDGRVLGLGARLQRAEALQQLRDRDGRIAFALGARSRVQLEAVGKQAGRRRCDECKVTSSDSYPRYCCCVLERSAVRK